MIKQIRPSELKARLDAQEDILVIDVREDFELSISQLDFAQQIVLHSLPARMHEVPHDKHVVFICRSGGRSMQAAQFLAANGWNADYLMNLDGGILAWAREVDPSLPSFY